MNSIAVSKSNCLYTELMHFWFTCMQGHFTYPVFPSAVLQLCCDHFCENSFVLQEACFLKTIVKICPLISVKQDQRWARTWFA